MLSFLIKNGFIVLGIGLFCKSIKYIYLNKETLLLDSSIMCLNIEANVCQLLNKARNFKEKYMPCRNNIFYYTDRICVYKTGLEKFDKDDTPLDYDYITCKQTINGEELTRFFEDEIDFVHEYEKSNNTINFNHCKKTIINAKIINVCNKKEEKATYNITPLKTAYCSGNKIFTEKYFKHFHNIDLPEIYSIRFIDSAIDSKVLDNKETIELLDTDYKILENKTKKDQPEKNEEEDNIILEESELISKKDLDKEPEEVVVTKRTWFRRN